MQTKTKEIWDYDPQLGFAGSKTEKIFPLPAVKPDVIVPVIEVF